MTLIMPMAGAGSRFKDLGFNLPKPLMLLEGKHFYEHAIDSLEPLDSAVDIIFVVLKEHVENFQIDKIILDRYPKAIVEVLDSVANGPCFSVMAALKHIRRQGLILVNDCDHYFESKAVSDAVLNGLSAGTVGGLVTFETHNPNFSYVKTFTDGTVESIFEKKVVSNQAVCGAYLFRDGETLESCLKIAIQSSDKKEAYLSEAITALLLLGKVMAFSSELHVSFGTPEEFTASQTLKDVRWNKHLYH